MNCVFYDRVLEKKVPCILIPEKLYINELSFKKEIYVHVYFDTTKYVEYSVTEKELIRYSSEFVNVNELYPANTQAQLDYITAVVPNLVTNNSDELDRYEALITMITETVGDISKDLFYLLSDFVSYELLFTKCILEERQFMLSLSATKLTEQPVSVLVPQMVRMMKRLFEKYTTAISTEYDIDNYNNYYEHDSSLPFELNIDNLKFNSTYVIT
jgi:hypothetical protein